MSESKSTIYSLVNSMNTLFIHQCFCLFACFKEMCFSACLKQDHRTTEVALNILGDLTILSLHYLQGPKSDLKAVHKHPDLTS